MPLRNYIMCYSCLHIFSYAGFYARITELEDIRSKVFEYIKVLARPMVLYQHEHPIHWSPAYVGGKVSKLKTLAFTLYLSYIQT